MIAELEKIVSRFTEIKIFSDDYSSSQLYQKYCDLVKKYGNIADIKHHARKLSDEKNIVSKEDIYYKKNWELCHLPNFNQRYFKIIHQIDTIHHSKFKYYYRSPNTDVYDFRIPKGCVIKLACDMNKYLIHKIHALKKNSVSLKIRHKAMDRITAIKKRTASQKKRLLQLLSISHDLRHHQIIKGTLKLSDFLHSSYDYSYHLYIFDKDFIQNYFNIFFDKKHSSDKKELNKIMKDKSPHDPNYMFIAERTHHQYYKIVSKIYKKNDNSLNLLVNDLIQKELGKYLA